MAKSSALIQSIRVEPVSFALKNPFVTAAGEKTRTDNVQVTINLSDGMRGVSEASTSIAMRSESQQTMLRVMREIIPELRGKGIEDYKDLIALCWRLQPYHPTATAALECAILDAYSRTQGMSLAKFFGGKKNSVESDLTLSVAPPETLEATAREAARKGFKRLKVKLSGQAPLDGERLLAVHRGAPKAELVADGNQGFSLSGALELARRAEKGGIKLAFFEQPFPKHDIRSMKLFTNRSHVALFADESVLTPSDALKLFEASAAHGVIVKVAKSGLLGALEIIKIAQRYKKRLGIGCMEESKTGLAASVHLACGTGVFEWVDLDSVFLLEPTRLRGGFTTKGATLSVAGIKSGIGIDQ